MNAVVGQGIDRVDGVLKVTGRAQYAADYPLEGLAYAVPVLSEIAKGRILAIDSEAAERAAGVLAVITRKNAPPLSQPKNDFGSATKLGEARGLFQDDRIYYAGQYVAIVVADSVERAAAAARLVRVDLEEARPALDLETAERFQPPDDFASTNYQRGDSKTALKTAPYQVSEVYSTPAEHHNPMEPSAATAVWNGSHLTVYDSTQWVVGARNVVADTLGIPRDNVQIVSRFVGGGFGCKGFVWPHTVAAAIAALMVGRPVKLALSRQQMFAVTGHRGATRQQLALGATQEGTLVAIQHENLTDASVVDDFIERASIVMGFLYECPNVSTRNYGARLNLPTPTPMRAPGETPGLFALESALDELAIKIGIDPVDLRLRNHSETDGEKGLPYSSKHLRECYELGMERFDWRHRQASTGENRDGRCFIGWGMATSTYPAYRSPGAARVRLLADGGIVVASATQDMGTGTYTTMSQVAADALGVPTTRIRVDLGDSSLPPAPVSGGSMTTASITPAVKQAADDVLVKLKRCAVETRKSPFHNLGIEEITTENGCLSSGTRSVSFGELLKTCELSSIESEAYVAPGAEMQRYAMHSFGAHFTEVRVDSDTGEVRVSKHVAVFDVGRVINSKTARSQLLGGITQGIGMALFEHTVYDRFNGRVVTNNLADYAVPVNADVPDIDVSFVEFPDIVISPVGARGIGEIGITGVAPAIANAVYRATGRRIRDLPITPDKLLRLREPLLRR